MQDVNTDHELSYFSEFIKSYNSQAFNSNYMFSPQLLNDNIKGLNMSASNFNTDRIRKMIMSPHTFEQDLRQLSLHYWETISLYKNTITLLSSMLEFDWEPTPYKPDGSPITLQDMSSDEYKKDFATLTSFFNKFNVKSEFKKVLWNSCMYDTYYTSVREYEDHIYLQELPSTHCIIDADSYLGYLFSFDLSYFTTGGVDVNSYSPSIRSLYSKAINSKVQKYNVNYPKRNGQWVHWSPLSPDDAWVFKYNNQFAGSIPPLLSAFIDYSKIEKFKDLEDKKKELEAYKVIFATVPRMSNGKSSNKADDFAISAEELGKFVSSVKNSLKTDFKAAPLENFKAFDFSDSSNSKNLLETTLKNIMMETGVTDAIGMPSTVNVASSNIYKTFNSKSMSSLYSQYNNFCEHQVNSRTDTYKFKIKFLGTMFDSEERRKNADSDMEKGIITPAIFSSRGIQLTDAGNITNMMYSLGFPESLRPIKTASTMSSDEKNLAGAPEKDESELADSSQDTRNNGSNEMKKEES